MIGGNVDFLAGGADGLGEASAHIHSAGIGEGKAKDVFGVDVDIF